MVERKQKEYSFADKKVILHRCMFQNQVSISLVDFDNSIDVRIFEAFQFSHDGYDVTIDPKINLNIQDLLSLLDCRIISILISSQGELKIEFDNGSSLNVPRNPRREAWTVTFTEPRVFFIDPPE